MLSQAINHSLVSEVIYVLGPELRVSGAMFSSSEQIKGDITIPILWARKQAQKD